MEYKKLFPPEVRLAPGSRRPPLAGLPGPALGAALCALKEAHSGPVIIICTDGQTVTQLHATLRALRPDLPCRLFSAWETLPYDQLSPHQDITSSRLELLATLPKMQDGFVVTSLSAVMPRLPPADFVQGHSFVYETGQTADPFAIRENLAAHGYHQVQQVMEHGEFAVRGSIVDIFPMGSDRPYRLDFMDDEIESISAFDPQTQRSVERLAHVRMLPAHEFPFNEEGIAAFRSNYRDAFPGANLKNHTIYQAVSRGAVPAGIEYYLPLFFPAMDTFFAYLPQNSVLAAVGNLPQDTGAFLSDAAARAEQHRGFPDLPPLPVNRLFLEQDELRRLYLKYPHCTFLPEAPLPDATPAETGESAAGQDADQSTGQIAGQSTQQATGEAADSQGSKNSRTAGRKPAPSGISAPQEVGLKAGDAQSAGRLTSVCAAFIDAGGRVLLSAQSEGRRQQLRELLPQALVAKYGIKAASSTQAFLDDSAPLMLTTAPFDCGAVFPAPKLLFLTENEIFGFKAARQKQRSRQSATSLENIFEHLDQLTEGQIVVHVDHGIGIYRGLKRLEIGGVPGEYLTIEYSGGDRLNIPVMGLNRVARYSGTENPQLSKLGADTWGKKKNKAVLKARDVAAELLDLYARRQIGSGRSFSVSQSQMDEFAAGFGYEETPDQQSAINAVLGDLASPQPMDRLVCGDVGFGKTEVALRAAFTVASCGAQVAVLVPTTVLAEQHYQNFSDRFSATAIRVEVMSRFKTAAEQAKILACLAAGTVDIVIATHRILSRGVKFKDLGLIIIDEEHRFGVKQKERLRELRASTDLLTLTATPIPRTLNMAMEGMRGLSIIATAPEHRLAVRTFVMERTDQICREAVMRELRRGGQVYYLHNDVSTIPQRKKQLEELIPEAVIGVGHGQMSERELQQVMRDFYQQRYNVLLCSTIIENGLDVPTANTIVIDRADLLGLAQLHQIRGRVGRSHHQAYAYLFTPPRDLLSKDAQSRLEAISQMEELGAGFVLATHDMEIRGAGELLGEEQSGQIAAVGFSLYTEMLASAVKALKDGREPSLAELTLNSCEVDMRLPALLPDDYIGDVGLRLSVYKRISSCHTPDQFEDLKVELIDRFGFLPAPTQNLFRVSAIRVRAESLGISRISGSGSGGIIEFTSHHKVSPAYLRTLITTCRHNEYRPHGQNGLKYVLEESQSRSRLDILEQLLRALWAHSTLSGQENQN